MKIQNPYDNELATAWLAATKSADWQDAECFASLLYDECRRQLARRSLRGLMAGTERDVEQEACTMLFGSFLLGNDRLQTATASEDLESTARHLSKSVKICLRFAYQRVARSRSRELAQQVDFSKVGESVWGTTLHPRLRTYQELPCEERCAMALAALQLALRLRVVSEKNAEVTRMTLVEGLCPRKIAHKLGVSPRAIRQQLARVSAQLRILKDAVEEDVK